MKNRVRIALGVLSLLGATINTPMFAAVTCGSQHSGFKVTGSAQLAAGSNGLSISDGMIRTTSTNQSSITGSLTCSNTIVQIDDTADDRLVEMTVDGTYAMETGAITLGANETLKLNGGTTESTVTINGTSTDPSIIEGSGAFGGNISVGASKQLNIDMQSAVNVNIAGADETSIVKLVDDLRFEDGKTITTGATVDCNEHRLITGSLDFSQDALTLTDLGLELNATMTLAGDLTLTTSGSINGNGHTLNFNGSAISCASKDLYLTDVRFASMVADSLVSPADVYVNDVTFKSSGANGATGEMTVGANGGSFAQLTLTDGNIFGSNLTINADNGAIITLDNNVTVTSSAVWTFNDDTVIIGNGNTLDISGVQIVVAEGVSLYFKDIMIRGWTGDTAQAAQTFGSIKLTNATTSDIYFSDATVRLSGNVSLNKGDVHVVGPTTFITGDNTFTASGSSSGRLYVDGVTLWYDTLRTPDSGNIVPGAHDGDKLFATNGGAIQAYRKTPSSLIYPNSDGSKPYLGRPQLLFSTSTYDGSGASGTSNGVTVRFKDGDGTNGIATNTPYSFDGNGRFLHFSNYDGAGPATLMQVDDNVTVTTRHVLLLGLRSANLQMGTTTDDTVANSAVLNFGDGTTIRLEENDTLTRTYTFADDGNTDDTMILDLNGHDLTLGSGGKIIAGNGRLTIKNGRIIGLKDTESNIITGNADATAIVEFEDVELVLEDDTTFDASKGKIEVTRDCLITGTDGKSFIFDATSSTASNSQSLTVNVNSMLTVGTGLDLTVSTTIGLPAATDKQVQNLVLTDGGTTSAHGTLNLQGGSLTAGGANGSELVVNAGRLIADHRASLDGGTVGMRLGSSSLTNEFGDAGSSANDLTIELMPGTLLNIAGGTVTYDNADVPAT